MKILPSYFLFEEDNLLLRLVLPDSSENLGIEDNESQDRDDDSEDNSGVVYIVPGIENIKRSDFIVDLFLLNSFIISSCNVDSLADDDCLKISGNVDENTEDDDGEHEGENSAANFMSSIVLLVQERLADSCVPDNSSQISTAVLAIFSNLSKAMTMVV